MNRNEDEGNLLMRFIYLFMDHLMHDPKRAVIFLLAVFAVTMITGEFIGAVRKADPLSTNRTAETSEPERFVIRLREIQDNGPVNLTPETEPILITETEEALSPFDVPSVIETPGLLCSEPSEIVPGMDIVIGYPGGYAAEINVRYQPENSKKTVGMVRSGDSVYILAGPVCLSGTRWWKINSDKYRIIGWIPERIGKKPVFSVP